MAARVAESTRIPPGGNQSVALHPRDRRHARNDQLSDSVSPRDRERLTAEVGQAVVYPREVMKSALRHSAAGLILAHNHVSGNPKPSQDDLRITERLSNAASLFDIVVHDHILIGGNSYFSFADKGLIQKA